METASKKRKIMEREDDKMQQKGVRGQTQRVSPNILSGLNQQQTRGGARVSPIDKYHTYNGKISVKFRA